MKQEDFGGFNFETQPLQSDKKQQKAIYDDPFHILYNARNSQKSKSRKSSASNLRQVPIKPKKSRKMTLQLQHKRSLQVEDMIPETFSENNYALSATYPQAQRIQMDEFEQEEYSRKELQKGIQFGIIQEKELDNEFLLGKRNQNPEFDMD